jgi:hypothetical protein
MTEKSTRLTHRPTWCAACELEIDWTPVEQADQYYCCAGCAAGGPCYCSYDEQPIGGNHGGAESR